jgi:hypothetical protein
MSRRAWAAAALAGLAGCGGGGGKGWTTVYPLKGTATYNGQPAADATVTFYPIDSGKGAKVPGGYARTDAQGRFNARTFGDTDGLAAGDFLVMFTKAVDESTPAADAARIDSPQPAPKFKSMLPAFLQNASSSPLKVTVMPSGPRSVEITLADTPGGCSIKPQ